jgi:uncharacterized membrane protein
MERRHEVTRLEGFSDAVFGFALTLLVVSLDVPENLAGLQDLMRGFLPFGLMFAMICYIWYEHQKFFRRYGLQDALTVAINAILLFVVLFYVYPLKYLTLGLLGRPLGMTHTPDLRQSAATVLLMYSGGVILVFGAFVGLYQRAWHLRQSLALTPVELIMLGSARRAHLLSLGLGVVSLGITLTARTRGADGLYMWAGLIYSLMGPVHAMNGIALHRAVRALQTPSPKARP